jgi:uncharacterized protein
MGSSLAMHYQRFGRTNLQMPVFSTGGMRYQQSWQDLGTEAIEAQSQDNLEATIRRSLEVGINHIETARAYGTSEIQLGPVLAQFPRWDLIVQTKAVPKADPEEFAATLERSLSLLQLDYVDLFSIHGINTLEILDWCTREGGCLDVARKFQREGRVRFIGFSTHGPTSVITEAIDTGHFDYVNLHWYYINQLNWGAIEAANRRDMGVFIISPSDKGGHLYNPPPKLVDLCQPLSPMVFNNLFCLSHPQIHTLSLGAARPGDFDEHLKTLPLLDRADELLPEILARLEAELVRVLGEDWARNWRVGLPEPEQTPGNVNIPLILWLRNLAVAYDMVDYAKARYNLLENGGHWFPGAQAGRVAEHDLRDCLRSSPFGDRIPALLQDAHEMLGGSAVKRLSQS